MTGRQGFFAIGKSQWARACELGLNPAVALLVLARGTGPDNTTTGWSGNAVYKYTGMAWRRAGIAIDALRDAKLLIRSKTGSKPQYKLRLPRDDADWLWLPNALVSGARGEPSPVARLRQVQRIDYLAAFIELYGMQDLPGDGGLP